MLGIRNQNFGTALKARVLDLRIGEQIEKMKNSKIKLEFVFNFDIINDIFHCFVLRAFKLPSRKALDRVWLYARYD